MILPQNRLDHARGRARDLWQNLERSPSASFPAMKTPILSEILARIRDKPPQRGERRRRGNIPANMAAAFLASEQRAWDHSPMAGMLWESGVRASRAISIAENSRK